MKSDPAYNQSEVDLEMTYLVLGRIAVLALALCSASLADVILTERSIFQGQEVYYALASLFMFCLVSGLWLRFNPQPGVIFKYTQLIADVLIVTGTIYVSGGPASPFLFLYLPLVMGAALVLSRGTALFVTAISTTAYAALVLSLLYGYLPVPGGPESLALPANGIVLQLVGLVSGMILIAVATSFLKIKLKSSYQQVERTQRDLVEASNRQKVIVDGIPAGVVVASAEGMVTNINAAASELFGVKDSKIDKLTTEELFLGKVELENMESLLNLPFGKHKELRLRSGGAGKQVTMVCHAHPVQGEDDRPSGKMFVFQDVTELRSIEEQLALQEKMASLLARSEEERPVVHTQVQDFVGESTVMRKVFSLIARVADSDATVLVNGESGTGKELVGRAIHLGGSRADQKFVAINCGAIPENLLESELFGHKKGAFTGADSDHTGLFRQAEGGTLFLDEIGELPIQVQAKLLRALQEKRVRPVGSDTDFPIDVRIVAATNKNLRKEVKAGNFREDLFYRLNVIAINLPPLRDRKEDIPLLVDSILRHLTDNTPPPIVPAQTMKLLLDYNYPGNVRELENVLERALVLGGEVVLPEHLPEIVQEYRPEAAASAEQRPETEIIFADELDFPVQLDEILQNIERRYLEVALLRSNGVKKKAASLLGINFRSLRYRLQKFGLNEEG